MALDRIDHDALLVCEAKGRAYFRSLASGAHLSTSRMESVLVTE